MQVQSIAEILLKFKIVQLEGKLALYESLVSEISQLESLEKAASEIKGKLEDVTKAWENHALKTS